MRILIAGGSGMIGRRLTSLLIDNGDTVTILSRDPAKVKEMPGRVKTLRWDGKTVQDWGKEIENTDAVVNLTGENLSGEGMFPNRWTRERKERLLSSRVNSGKVLTEAIEMAGHKPSVFIQASGIGYYGVSQDKTFTEEDSAGNDFMAALSKEWEASSAPVESQGLRRVVIRNGVVLSTTGGALRPILLQYKLFAGGPLGSGKQVYSWIHIDDEAGAIRFLILQESARGAFNLTAPNPATNNEFGRTVGKVMRRPHYFPIPSFTMHLAFGEVASMVLEGQRVIPKKLLELGYVFRFPVLEGAVSDLLRHQS
jgi:uncharacterized protein